MSRITVTHVRSALERYASACKEAGLIPEGMHVHMEEGSQTYGRAWHVYLTGDMVKDADGRPTYPKGSGCSRPPCGDDYLGWTAEEARAALLDRTQGMRAVLDRMGSQSEKGGAV